MIAETLLETARDAIRFYGDGLRSWLRPGHHPGAALALIGRAIGGETMTRKPPTLQLEILQSELNSILDDCKARWRKGEPMITPNHVEMVAAIDRYTARYHKDFGTPHPLQYSGKEKP